MLENALLVCLIGALAWYVLFMPRIFSARWAKPPEGLPPVNWHSGHAVAVFFLYFGLQVAAASAADHLFSTFGYGEDNQVLFVATIILVYALNVITFLFIVAIAGASAPPSQTLGFRSAPLPASVKAGLAMFLVFLPLQAAFPTIVDTVWVALFREAPKEQEAVEVFMNAGPALLVLIAFVAVVLAPLCEELIFRAFIQKGLENNLGRPAAILLTAGLFAAAHGGIATGIKVLPLAIVLSVAYDRTRNIVSNIVFHAAFNAASLAVALIARDEGLDLGLLGP